jgi:hypothetical protein
LLLHAHKLPPDSFTAVPPHMHDLLVIEAEAPVAVFIDAAICATLYAVGLQFTGAHAVPAALKGTHCANRKERRTI